MFKIVFNIMIFALLWSAQSAKACSGYGLVKEEIVALMTEIQGHALADSRLENSKVLSIVWGQLTPRAGAEGDCEAKGLESTIYILAKKSDEKYCQFRSPVKIFKSNRLGNQISVKLQKSELDICEW